MELVTYKDYRSNKRGEQNVVKPYEEKNLAPFGIDLTVGKECYNLTTGERIYLEGDKIFPMRHGDFVVIWTSEELDVPSSWFGLVSSKVSLVAQGLTHIGTKVDPGFKGRLQLSFKNDGHRIIELKEGRPICNVAFFRLPEATGKDYEGAPPIPVTLEPPLSFRYQLTEQDRTKLEKHYSREFVDLYYALWERVIKEEEKFDSRIKRLDFMVIGIIVAVIVALLCAIATVVLTWFFYIN